MPADTKLYDILGVSKSAGISEIKKAYHKLAKSHHPDKNPEKGDKFKEISFAYEVLSDPEKKRTYDQYGLEGLEGGAGAGGGNFADLFDLLGGGGGGGHPFASMFGGMGGGRMGGRRGKRRGDDIMHPLRVTLNDLYNGKTSKLQLSRTVLCKRCEGRGGKAGATQPCKECNGRGVKVSIRQIGPGMIQQMQGVCPKCHGQGDTIADKDKCKSCNGERTTKEKKILEVHVDMGMKHGQRVPFRGMGDEEPDVEPGDVIVVLQQEEHDVFKRQGNDLYMQKTIGLVEALCGFSFVVKHLDDRSIVVHNKPGGQIISPGATLCVPDEGMPVHRNPFVKGNLVVKFDVAFPPERFAANDAQLKELEQLLPDRCQLPPPGPDAEEVNLTEYDERDARFQRGDDEDDEDGAGMGGARVGCQQQ